MDITLNNIIELHSAESNYETYLYHPSESKFIYESTSEMSIIGVSNLLNDKIIEIKQQKNKDDRVLSLVAHEDQIVGWIELDMTELTRLYRTPNLTGKLEESIPPSTMSEKYANELNLLKNKILKVQYYFEEKDKSYFFVHDVSKSTVAAVDMSSFIFLNKPQSPIFIHLEIGVKLYRHSNLNSSVGEIKSSKDYEVISYFNKSDLVRIKRNEDFYWVSVPNSLEPSTFKINDKFSLNLMDYLVWISRDRFILNNAMSRMTKKLDFLRRNLVVSNDFDKLYIERHLGEKDDSKPIS